MKRYLRHALVALVTPLVLGLALVFELPARLDQLAFDFMLRLDQRVARDDILIVAIDSRSIDRLGRWPWARSTHASLVDKLSAAGARVIGLDIVLSERDTDNEASDTALARSIEAAGNVVLVTAPEEGEFGSRELLPLPDFAIAAAALGHVDYEVDDDGITRSVYLLAGWGRPHWPAFGLALAREGYPENGRLPVLSPSEDFVENAAWTRSYPALISWSGPPGHFNRVSYIDVLQDRVPIAELRDRIVLVGATAVGLGDALATPLSRGHTLMPGIEVNAMWLPLFWTIGCWRRRHPG